ncbi:unnamed protein product [Dovyalis caffra]|uniref:3-oxo-5-alpha-steroid 4-dehydrogenase C-terminal domain-containing protein n=1 Tax=Dovyalis caffra TaxID=77055 RepID=A0AAV1QTR2_9ROSI|nr:unnamed protein product [Dovyalis caffra]
MGESSLMHELTKYLLLSFLSSHGCSKEYLDRHNLGIKLTQLARGSTSITAGLKPGARRRGAMKIEISVHDAMASLPLNADTKELIQQENSDCYFTSTVVMLYTQHLTQGLPEPEIDLRYPGIALFLTGISGIGNLYQHCLLPKLRSKSDKEYKVPNGGLFDLVICRHYLFEILGFLGISLIAQKVYAFSFTSGSILYLMGRSYGQEMLKLFKTAEKTEGGKMESMLLKLLFPSPFLVKAMSVVSSASLGYVGLSEVRGKHMKYSKFLNVDEKKPIKEKIRVSSRTGMLMAYTPPFLVGAASFGLFPNEDLRFLLVKSTLTFHFFKRILEVLYVHSYSGGMEVESLIPITLSYFTAAVFVIYAQNLAQGLPAPAIDLMYPGLLLFLIGISGNFYHHCILSKLRSTSEKGYKIPKGGLFDLVICPHYLFEILGILGIALTAQTLYAFAFFVGSTLYLMGRSYATRKWYLSQFPGFPKDVKSLIPFVF